MFLVAQTYEKGSDEFNEVFDVAVRMFPDDPTANINAAAIELQRGDLQQAVRYLEGRCTGECDAEQQRRTETVARGPRLC